MKQKTNCLTNPNCTRGIRGNKLINLYIQNNNRLWLSKLSYYSLALYLQNYNALIQTLISTSYNKLNTPPQDEP